MNDVASPAKKSVRTFKTAWFAKAARKAHIPDEELCPAIQQVMLGQADDLGGGVFKKRLKRISTAPSLLPGPGSFGFMSICLPSRIGRTLTTMNLPTSESW